MASSNFSHFRWVICVLLFFAAAINSIDRQVIGMLLAGRVMDRIGVRLGLALAVIVWSLGAIAHAMADWFPWLKLPTVAIDPPAIVLLGGAIAGFAVARVILGLSEAGNFPASIKTVAEWFPKKERALATGIFNSGTNVGARVTPMLVPWITLTWGWQWAFISTGLLGFVGVVFWLIA